MPILYMSFFSSKEVRPSVGSLCVRSQVRFRIEGACVYQSPIYPRTLGPRNLPHKSHALGTQINRDIIMHYKRLQRNRGAALQGVTDTSHTVVKN